MNWKQFVTMKILIDWKLPLHILIYMEAQYTAMPLYVQGNIKYFNDKWLILRSVYMSLNHIATIICSSLFVKTFITLNQLQFFVKVLRNLQTFICKFDDLN